MADQEHEGMVCLPAWMDHQPPAPTAHNSLLRSARLFLRWMRKASLRWVISKHLVDGWQCNLCNLDLSIAFLVLSEKTSWKSPLGWGWWPTMDIKFRCCVLLGKLFILCQQLWAVWTTANSYRSLPQCHTPVWRLRRRYGQSWVRVCPQGAICPK